MHDKKDPIEPVEPPSAPPPAPTPVDRQRVIDDFNLFRFGTSDVTHMHGLDGHVRGPVED